MSRLFIVASLITGFTSFAAADRIEPRFAQPPDAPHAMPHRQTSDRDQPDIADRAQVRARLAANRAANVTRFRAYQNAGVFPSNTYQSTKLNVWRDRDGHLCAAATIIKASGQGALVTRVAEHNNFIKLGEVKQGPVMDWILTSGLTQDEIAAIQEVFMPVGNEPSEPARPLTVNRDLRKTEDARLRAVYKAVEAQIVTNQAASLDAATDRLLKNPMLAMRMLGMVDG